MNRDLVPDDPMRTRDEIQRAHDILVPLVLNRDLGAMLDEAAMGAMICHLDVLCWVLRHDHNQVFGLNLANVEAVLHSLGIELVRSPEMQYPGGKKS